MWIVVYGERDWKREEERSEEMVKIGKNENVKVCLDLGLKFSVFISNTFYKNYPLK